MTTGKSPVTTPSSSLIVGLLIEILDDLVTLAGRDDVEWADDIRRKIHRLREAQTTCLAAYEVNAGELRECHLPVGHEGAHQ